MSNFSQGQGNQGIPLPALRREQVIPQIDPREIGCTFHGAGAEIAEKGHFWMETNLLFFHTFIKYFQNSRQEK